MRVLFSGKVLEPSERCSIVSSRLERTVCRHVINKIQEALACPEYTNTSYSETAQVWPYHARTDPAPLAAVRQRVNFKLATLTCTILHTGQPCYLNELIDFYEPVRQLRSSSQWLLYCDRSRTVLALRGFKHSSVAAWHS